jgi:hypothetical protein
LEWNRHLVRHKSSGLFERKRIAHAISMRHELSSTLDKVRKQQRSTNKVPLA